MTLSAITTAVETAITEKRIGEDKKEHFINLGKKIGVEDLKQTFAAMSPMVKLSAVIGHQGGTPTQQPTTYSKFSEVPGAELERCALTILMNTNASSRLNMALSVKSKMYNHKTRK